MKNPSPKKRQMLWLFLSLYQIVFSHHRFAYSWLCRRILYVFMEQCNKLFSLLDLLFFTWFFVVVVVILIFFLLLMFDFFLWSISSFFFRNHFCSTQTHTYINLSSLNSSTVFFLIHWFVLLYFFFIFISYSIFIHFLQANEWYNGKFHLKNRRI